VPRELFANALYVRIPGPLRKVGAKLLALAACSGCDRQAWRRLTSSELFEKESACPSCCRRSRTAEDERRYRENYRAANKVTIDAWQRNYYKSQPWRTAGYRLKAKYGLSLSDKQVMLDAQGGRCKLCPREISLLKAAVDHSHATGVVRGLLCQGCNGFVVGLVEKLGPEGLKRVAAYLVEAREPGWS